MTAVKGGRPPSDVALLDMRQVCDAMRLGVIEEYPVDVITHSLCDVAVSL